MAKVKSGKLIALVGRSRSGKTQKAISLIKQIPCVMIWDVEGQYENVTHRATNQRELAALVKACAGKKAVIGYTGRLSDFNYFCKAAFIYVRLCGVMGKKSGVVFEETADVTSPAKAPEHYGVILRRGLKYGCDLFAITQRPAESDKTSVGNASIIHICAMNIPSDKKYMANMSGVPLAVVDGLRADQDNSCFSYVTVDTNRAAYDLGELTFVNDKPVFRDLKRKIPL